MSTYPYRTFGGQTSRPTRFWITSGILALLLLVALKESARIDSYYQVGGLFSISPSSYPWEEFQNHWTLPPGAAAGADLRDLKSAFRQRDENSCRGWSPESAIDTDDIRWEKCWRHKPYKQLHHFFSLHKKPGLDP